MPIFPPQPLADITNTETSAQRNILLQKYEDIKTKQDSLLTELIQKYEDIKTKQDSLLTELIQKLEKTDFDTKQNAIVSAINNIGISKELLERGTFKNFQGQVSDPSNLLYTVPANKRLILYTVVLSLIGSGIWYLSHGGALQDKVLRVRTDEWIENTTIFLFDQNDTVYLMEETGTTTLVYHIDGIEVDI